MADIMLNSNKVSTEKIMETAFEFADLEGALSGLYA